MNLDQKNLSIIIVGRFSEFSNNLIYQVISNFPNCKTIISSFDKYKFQHFKDKNVFVMDSNLHYESLPGYIAQQKLIMQAEKFVDTEYVLKIRTDLLDIVPLHWIEEGLEKLCINSNRFVVTQFFSKNPKYINQFGHPSDMIIISRRSDLFDYFRNVVQNDNLEKNSLANEQIYFFSHASTFPKYTYSFNYKTIRSYTKIGRKFYILPLENPKLIFPDRFIENDNLEIRWKEGNFVQNSLVSYLFFALVNKFNLRRFYF